MILRLTASDFGKFRGRSFELGAVTVVHGPNEAGKTTFFDALFQALCRPSESKKMGKELKQRYGASRKAEATLSGTFDLDEDEFLNLCAIRTGDLSLEMGKDSPWLERLKSRLFHGGLDPAALASEFERRSSDRRNFAHMKEIEALRDKVAAARGELDARRRERDGYLERERLLLAEEARLGGILQSREAGLAALKAKRARLAFEDRIERRRRLAARLARLDDLASLAARMRELEAFAEDRRAELEALAAAAGTASGKSRQAAARRDLQADQAARARAEVRRLESELPRHADRSALAAATAAGFRSAVMDGAPDAFPRWSLAAAALLWAFGLTGLGVLEGALLKMLSLGGAAVLGAVLLLLARGARVRRKARISADAFANAKDRFTLGELELAGRPPAMAPGRVPVAELAAPEAFLQALDSIAAEAAGFDRELQAARRRLEEAEADRVRLEAEAAEAGREEEDARRAVREWLSRLGVAQPEEYRFKVEKHAELKAEAARRESEAALPGMGSPEEERRDLGRQLKDMDEEGVPPQGLDEAALRRLKREVEDLESQVEAEGLAITELTGRKKEQEGSIHGALGKLAGEIVRAEEALLDCEDRLAVKELDKQAARVACEIFKEIGEEADLLLSGLSREVEAMLAHILPGDRQVALSGLDQKQILVADAAGGRRPLECLSTGTRDAVVLAAKLALALKTREGPGLLVLDDPFLAMDRQREERALLMLQEFHLRHGWQIILLTKDSLLRDAMGRIFPDLRQISL